MPRGAQTHTDFQFAFDSMELVTDIKNKVEHAVETSYEFDTSRAPDKIRRNIGRAQALLSEMTFVYRVRLTRHHLQPTEHRHVGYRDSTLAHFINIDIPLFRR